MQPGFLVVALLDDHPEHWFRSRGTPLAWPLILPAYWLAVVANIVWARRWLIRHFDKLAERSATPPASDEVGLIPRQATFERAESMKE
jgi:hypothetical protein